jgi:hypothetical protein
MRFHSGEPIYCIFKRCECLDSEASVFGTERKERGVVKSFGGAKNSRLLTEGLAKVAKLTRQVPKIRYGYLYLCLSSIQEYFVVGKMGCG